MKSMRPAMPKESSAKSVVEQESFEDRQRRQQAQRILNSYEQLLWHSVARHESVPQTRRHFQQVACGFLRPGDDDFSAKIDHTPLPDAYTCISASRAGDGGTDPSKGQASSSKRKAAASD